jgi:hypothetical protein
LAVVQVIPALDNYSGPERIMNAPEIWTQVRSLVTTIQNSRSVATAIRELKSLIQWKQISQSAWVTAPDHELARDTVQALKVVVRRDSPDDSTQGMAAEVLGLLGKVARSTVSTIASMLDKDDNRKNHLLYVRAMVRLVSPRDTTMPRGAVRLARFALVDVLTRRRPWSPKYGYEEPAFDPKARAAAAEGLWCYGGRDGPSSLTMPRGARRLALSPSASTHGIPRKLQSQQPSGEDER